MGTERSGFTGFVSVEQVSQEVKKHVGFLRFHGARNDQHTSEMFLLFLLVLIGEARAKAVEEEKTWVRVHLSFPPSPCVQHHHRLLARVYKKKERSFLFLFFLCGGNCFFKCIEGSKCFSKTCMRFSSPWLGFSFSGTCRTAGLRGV